MFAQDEFAKPTLICVVVLGVFLGCRVSGIPRLVTLSCLVFGRVIALRRKVDVLVVNEPIWDLTFSRVGFL